MVLGAVPVQGAVNRPPHKPQPNVILITIDTVRADRLGCYGAKNIQTTTLDALGRDGVVFERAISQVPLTWPSHAAILTGLYPFQNGVQDFTANHWRRAFVPSPRRSNSKAMLPARWSALLSWTAVGD